jgi:DNA primase
VREAVDLVALISEYVPLQPKGREWIGVCPFHDDHKPSLNVVTHKENAFYKCFSCNASGDCFTFVQKYFKKDFIEALQFLAERVGIELSNQQHEDAGPSLRRKLRSAMEWSTKLYCEALLKSPMGESALKTLHDRGVTDESIEKFSIGVAPEGWEFLSDRVRDNVDQITICIEAGLIKKKDSTDRVYDTFRHRLMFPICDEIGSTIAFGGRRLREEDEPKYINSPDTELFHKSKTLYGYHLARPAIQSTNKAIVVEGYTDVIACHQAGISNVVATLGTALTADHAAILSRICDEVILVFDGDDAGQRAADRAVEVFFSKEIDVQICVLPEGKDPADLVDDTGTLQSCFEKSIDAMAFKLDRLEESLQGTDTISGRAKRIESFLDELVRLGIGNITGVRKPLVYERIAALLKVSMTEVESHIASRRKKSVSPTTATQSLEEPVQHQTRISRARRLAEHEFLAVLLFDPTESSAALREEKPQIDPKNFMEPSAAHIAARILPRLKAGTPYSMQELLPDLEDESAKLASTLYFDGQRISETSGSVMLAVKMTTNAFLSAIQDRAIEDEVRELQSVTDPSERAKIAQQTLETIRRQKLTRSRS